MGGGLALLWDLELDVNLKTLSKSHIDVIVIEKDGVFMEIDRYIWVP